MHAAQYEWHAALTLGYCREWVGRMMKDHTHGWMNISPVTREIHLMQLISGQTVLSGAPPSSMYFIKENEKREPQISRVNFFSFMGP